MAVGGPAIAAMSREEFVARGQELSVPCALCATALAELGADVIKIESPTVPDTTRGPCLGDSAIHEPSGAETSPVFAKFSRSIRASPCQQACRRAVR